MFYNSWFQCLFSFGQKYPSKIVANRGEKVNDFQRDIVRKQQRVRDASLWKFVIYIDVSKHMRKELEKQGKRKSINIFVTGYREYMEVAFDVNSNLI